MALTTSVLTVVLENPVTAILTLISLTALTLLWRSSQKKKYNLPPGPRGLPILGNIIELSKEPLVFKLFVDMAKKYGPIFRIRIGMIETVVLNSYDAILDGLLRQQNEFAGRPSFYSAKFFGNFDKSIFLGDFTPAWAVQRKIAHSAIRKYASGKHLEDLMHYSMDNVADLIMKEKGAFDPKYIMSLLVYNIIAVMCFGKRFELDDPTFTEIIDLNEKSTQDFGNGLAPDFIPFLGPLYDIVPFAFKKSFKEFDERFGKMLEETLEEHEKNYDPENITDLTYHVLHDLKALDGDKAGNAAVSKLERAHLVTILSDMFLAGTDTSRFTLIWMLQNAAANPKIQAKIQKEVDSVVGQNQPVLIAHRTQLPYCEAVLYETVRMRPPATLALPHKTTCDTSLGGYDIPAGTQVLPNLWAIHMDPQKWDKPEEFRPERFLDKDGQLLPKVDNFLPFSTGRRVCVGEALAKTELHMFIAMLFQKFSFFPGPEEKLDGKMTDNGLGCIPAPFKIVAKPRF